MTTSQNVAKHFRGVFLGENWCGINLKGILADVTWQEATAQVHSLNSILKLTYHMGYYVTGVLQVLRGGALEIRDKFSFDHPEITSEAEWQELQNSIWANVEAFAALVEQLPEEQLWQDFTDPKYGTYYSNMHGITEHTFYHLGQVVIIKKLLREGV